MAITQDSEQLQTVGTLYGHDIGRRLAWRLENGDQESDIVKATKCPSDAGDAILALAEEIHSASQDNQIDDLRDELAHLASLCCMYSYRLQNAVLTFAEIPPVTR